MNTLMQGFLDNDSFFGRFMTKLGIIIAANIMFVLLSIPFFTIGAGLSALYYVMFRTLRNDGVVNPFKEFMTGLKLNFRQATVSWILFVLLFFILLADIRICNAAGGALDFLKIGAYTSYGKLFWILSLLNSITIVIVSSKMMFYWCFVYIFRCSI